MTHVAAELARLKLRVAQLERSGQRVESAIVALEATPAVARIIDAVCEVTGLQRTQIVGHRRFREFIDARHCACWLATERTTYSYPRIGRALGGRDHTTVMHAARRWRQRLDALEPGAHALTHSVTERLDFDREDPAHG